MSSATRDKNVLKPEERFGELVGVAIMILIIAFFVYHQVSNTGFFTQRFGPLEAFLFYAAGVAGMAAPILRAVTGSRVRARWFDLGSSLLWAVASIWLLIVFPFNFAHVGTPLPAFLQFTVSWVSNYVGRIILVLSALGGIITTIYCAVRIALDRGKSPKARSVEPRVEQSANL